MRQFTRLRSVLVVFILFHPTLNQAAGNSLSESSSSNLHLIAAAFVGLCFAMPVLWKTAKTFLKSRSQKVKNIKKDDTLV
jgi:preprotein translocase subunit SecG